MLVSFAMLGTLHDVHQVQGIDADPGRNLDDSGVVFVDDAIGQEVLGHGYVRWGGGQVVEDGFLDFFRRRVEHWIWARSV